MNRLSLVGKPLFGYVHEKYTLTSVIITTLVFLNTAS